MGKSNFGVLSSMRRGVFLFFSFLFCAFVTGCEEAEVVSSRRSVPKDGFVQTRTTEDGTTFAALVVAPRIPGYAPVSVTHLKKIDFLKDVKARGTDPGATGWFNNVFRVAENIYSLRVENVFQEDGNQFFGTAQMIRDEFVPDVFTSDDWVVFDCAVPQGSDALEVKFSNGTISAKVNIELQGNTATVSYNDGPFQPPLNLFGGGGDPRPLRIVLPVNNNPIFGGVSNEVLREYLGTWTVETTPALTDETFQLPATPFQFDLNAVIVDEITYQKKPNFVDTEGNEFYGGATFTAKAKVVGPGSDNPLRPDIPQNFACRAKVRGLDRTLGFDGVVHERILATGAVTRGGATLSFDWDGVGPGSVRYPAELDFGVSFWGLVTGSTPESVLNDQSATGDPAVGGSHSGPPGFFDEPNYNLEVSPNPFIPPEEEYIDLDGDGELDWNDYDQDGIPDGWPPEADTDGDGLPDVPPPDPFVTITAEPRKNGYDTKNWVIHVEDEEGNQIPDATFMGDTPTAYIEWTPPAELEPQILKVGIHAGLCRNRTLPLTVRAQDGGESEDGCLVVPEVFAELAYGELEPRIEVFEFEENKPLKKVAVISKDEDASARDERQGLLEKIYRWENDVGSNTLKIRVRGFEPTGRTANGKDKVDLLVRNLNTNTNEPQKTLEVQLLGTATKGVYEGEVTLDENLLHGEEGTSYTVSETYRNLNESLFVGVNLGGSPSTYPPPVRQFGSLSDRAIDRLELTGEYQNGELPSDEVPPTPANLLAFGFEPLSFQPTNEPVNGLRAILKVQNSAKFAYLNVHGTKTGLIQLGGDRDISRLIDQGDTTAGKKSVRFDPEPPYANLTRNLRTLIMASCSVLNLNDYNNIHVEQSSNGSWPNLDARRFGGTLWDQATGQGENNTVLLGYGDISLYGYSISPNTMGKYKDELNTLSSVADLNERQALAWLSANMKVVLEKPREEDDETLKLLGACAITKDYYYYIPYRRGVKKTVGHGSSASPYVPDPATVNELTPIYRIPRASWYSKQPQDWEYNRNMIAQPVSNLNVTFKWEQQL